MQSKQQTNVGGALSRRPADADLLELIINFVLCTPNYASDPQRLRTQIQRLDGTNGRDSFFTILNSITTHQFTHQEG